MAGCTQWYAGMRAMGGSVLMAAAEGWPPSAADVATWLLGALVAMGAVVIGIIGWFLKDQLRRVDMMESHTRKIPVLEERVSGLKSEVRLIAKHVVPQPDFDRYLRDSDRPDKTIG